ncbi:rho GTPase-activating protein 7 isoform X3 [Periplaneta americana]
MTSRVAMDTMRPDERAAGVISGADPYRELELYLEKVNEEIGEVFDQWQSSRKPSACIPIPKHRTPTPPPPPPHRQHNGSKAPPPRPKQRDLSDWSEGLLAEFNSIIAQELSQLEANGSHALSPSMRLRISRSHSWENSDPDSSSQDLTHRALGLARVLRRQRSPLVPGGSPGDAVLVRVSSLPDSEVHLTASDPDIATRSKNESAASPVPRSDSTGALPRLDHKNNETTNGIDDISMGKCSIAASPAKDIVQTLLTAIRQPMDVAVDAGTQTSPPLSRSSSFTWVSTSSLLLQTDEEDEDEARSTSSSGSSCSPQRSSSRDSLSDSPLGSIERDEPESGIGTASPPRSKDHAKSAATPGAAKVRRKETWERLRRRGSSGRPPYRGGDSEDVWVRRESVETQTREDCSSLPRPARPRCLPITPHHLRSTPSPDSPSTASLKLTTTPLAAELGNKSSSAPLLVKQAASPGAGGGKPEDNAKKRILTQPRSQSERHLAEIEAAEACKWLRAAGFPQYAQMYEDFQFPIDVSGVQKDHPFLDPDSLQSLFRRLHALNRCAKMKVDNMPKNSVDDSDDDDPCALSENWTFQPESRRWSRVCEVTAQHAERLQALSAASGQEKEQSVADDDEEPLRLLDEEEDYDPEEIPVISSLRYGSLPPGHPGGDPDLLAVRFRRTGSERLRDGAKALLRRMESLKSRRRRRQNRDGVVISGPQVLDVTTMQQRMKDLNCVDVSPTGTCTSSPDQQPPIGLTLPPSPSSTATPTPSPASGTLVPVFGDDSSDGSQGGGSSTAPPHHRGRSKLTRAKKLLRSSKADDHGALSDSECQPTSWRQQFLKDANSNHTKVLDYVDGRTHDHDSVRRTSGSSKSQARTGSLNLGKESQRYREKLQGELRKDVTVYRDKSGSSELMGSQDSSSTLASQAESDHDDGEATPRHKGVVVRWHSFQRGSSRPDSYLFRATEGGGGVAMSQGSRPLAALSCGQLLVLRKLALLKLTACMERYCPTHRTGWNWELPKFIRKIKTPDYKDKTVFGVPLLLSLQRNGQALPKCIQAALRWLRINSLDQVGIFRKSGVRSRIQKLKLMTESQGESISFDGQQAYDVADMVKQYFRELPEALLTNKLSETFIAIFQHVPNNLRAEAVQCVLLLLPDEHREALQTLLEFLCQVSARSACNQMTASNLAVCLAPSVFHLHHTPSSSSSSSRSSSASPRRRKTVGVPDQRELGENRAAHDCLLYLIKEHRELFMVSEETLAQCHFNYMEESIPVALEELGAEFQQDWRGYLYACTTALLKEAREKCLRCRSRGWVSMPCTTDGQVEMAYKKVGDGHPLRLWRVSTEVEAPPLELLQRVLRERHVWDYTLLKWRIVARLDPQVEVFQYVCASMAPLPAKDFCVLRSWRTDLPKGACVIVETSVEHPDGPVMLGGVRGIVLASRYLIEPCGSGKSRIMHLSRVDTKGRTPEWYNKSYGHICALYLTRIRSSFKHNTEGPESKV